LALAESPKTTAAIKTYVETATSGMLTADDKSLYRSLRRYYDTEMVDYTLQPNPKGPATKLYALSAIGRRLLDRFVTRNMCTLINNPQIQEILA
jgi:DNA-binding PadR family transcriptional regulator